jgi:hypothetical protein
VSEEDPAKKTQREENPPSKKTIWLKGGKKTQTKNTPIFKSADSCYFRNAADTSHILGRMARIVPADWQRIYGHEVVFLETFVDPTRYKGTCYRAANWTVLGDTTGRGKNDLTHKANRSIKQVLGYPLCRDFRQRLGDDEGKKA